jgi:putative tryptophan/tyrosine transport system substrate-binding protein
MRRRNLLFGLLAVATMGGARAEQSRKAHRIAIVHPTHPAALLTETGGSPAVRAVLGGLRRLGYVEGQNLLIERYSGEGRASHYPELARAVVSRNPDLIITLTNNLALDFKAAATTIPIVGMFAVPVEDGIVASLAQPGGNITGVSIDVGPQQWGKRVQLLQQVVPQAARFGFLQSRASREKWGPNKGQLHGVGVTWVGPPLDRPIDESEYRRVFAALAQDGAEVISVNDEAENVTNLRLIVELAGKARLPAIYPFKVFVEAGGLMSYGIDFAALGHRVADMVDEILKGAKPSDIPIFQPTKFELAINLKTAKALGLTVPPELLATADEIIE